MGTSPQYLRLATSATRSLMETAFDALWDPVLVVDARLAHVPVVLANAAARREFKGESADDPLIEKSVYALLVPESVSTVQALLEGSSEAVGSANSALSWRLAAGIRALPTEFQCLDCAPGQRLLMLRLRLSPPVQPPAEPVGGARSAEPLVPLSLGLVHMQAWRWHEATDVLEFADTDAAGAELAAHFPILTKLLRRVHPNDRGRLARQLARAVDEREQVQDEFRLKMHGGRYRWYALGARPLAGDGAAARPAGLVGVLQDITARQESLAGLRESEALLRVATANTADTLVLLGVDLKVRFVNRGFRGMSVSQLLGRDAGVLLPESARLAVLERLRHVLKTGEEAVFDFDFGADCVGPRYFENRAVLVKDEGIGRCISLTLSDITDRKRLEKEILDVSSRERHSIGRDLHDGLGQELTGVALMLRGLATRLQRHAPDAVGYLDEVVALVNQSIETTRGLARGLLPVCTESGGLPYALEELATRTRARYGLDVHFRAEIWPALTLSERDASHLYRIAQEALTNAARHAKPTRVEIFLLVTGSTYLLSITDDGLGYGNVPASEAGMGLKIMSYRASMVGAKFDIFRAERAGTVVRINGEQPLPPITL